jgi:pimeloyl-ACP methyl ester carboxylesterase
MHWRAVWLAALACAGAAGLASADRAAADALACAHDETGVELCKGYVRVPLDRSGRIPGTLDLIVHSERDGRGTGTLLELDDTPTPVDANPLASQPDDDAFEPLLRGGRLITFDRRGTGRSHPLTCSALAGGDPLTSGSACAAQLGPARTAFTTAESVADVDAVRAAFGVSRMSIYGVGEGARLALAYAAAHPERVARLLLDSPISPEGADPFRRSTIASIPRVLRALCRRTCRFTRHPEAEFQTLAAHLAQAPLLARVFDGRGRPHRVAFGAADLLRATLGEDPFGVYLLPAAVHAALHGDPASLGRSITLTRRFRDAAGRQPVDAATLARACEDDPMPWSAGTPVSARRAAMEAAFAMVASAFAPFDASAARAAVTADRCLGWPESPIVQPHPALPAVPTLILSGELDLDTPLADARALAARLPGAQLLVVPNVSHGVIGDEEDCVTHAIAAFARGSKVAPCPSEQGETMPTAPPRALHDLRPVGHRLPARLGRTVAAADATVIDAFIQGVDVIAATGRQSVRFGGLRSGFGVFSGDRLVLHEYSYVPGVTVSMEIGEHRTVLRIGGRAAVHGRLTRMENCGDGSEESCFVGKIQGRTVKIGTLGGA